MAEFTPMFVLIQLLTSDNCVRESYCLFFAEKFESHQRDILMPHHFGCLGRAYEFSLVYLSVRHADKTAKCGGICVLWTHVSFSGTSHVSFTNSERS